jgi:hypothetical protein
MRTSWRVSLRQFRAAPGETGGMECDVLRCGNLAESFFDAGSPASCRIDVGVCPGHQSKIDRGDRRLYELDAPAGACLLMGEDLMPRVARVTTRRFITDGGKMTRVFAFEAENHDGSPRDIEVELPPEIAEGVWRVLGRDHGQGG